VNRNDAELAVQLARDLAHLDRRGFLRLLGAAAGVGLLPTACGPGAEDLAPPPDLALRSLTPRAYAVLNAAARRIVGATGEAMIRAGEVDPGARIDAFLASSPALLTPVRQALLALEFAMPPLSGKLRPFTALEPGEQYALLADLMHSRFALRRALFNGVRTFAVNGFYGSRASRPVVHYPEALGRGEPRIEAAMRWDESDFPERPRSG